MQERLESLFRRIRSEKKETGPVTALVVGLGNPGREYAETRHNVGYWAVERLAAAHGARLDRLKFKSLCADCTIGGNRVLLMKPSTFMNRSGEAVREAMAFYKISPERVILIFDDVSLEPARLRIRKKGSDGGHNGMKNIIYLCGSDQFPRIKIGVGGKPHPDYELKDWVLGKFDAADREKVEAACVEAAEAAEMMIRGEIDQAMNRYNR